jgi:hypothetical protein
MVKHGIRPFNLKKIHPLSILAILHVWLFHKIFLGGLLFGSDNILTGVTVRTFAHDYWQLLGRLPYWNPYICAGAPYLGNFVSVGFYPINLMLMSLPPVLAMNLLPFLHVGLATCFAYLTLNLLVKERLSALIGALTFSLSGIMTLRLFSGHYDAISVISWGVVLFYLWTKYSLTFKPIWVFLAAVALAMQITAGYPQYVYLTHLLLFPYLIGITFHHAKNNHGTWKAILAIIGYFCFGLGLSAIQWLPAMHLLQSSIRHGGVDWSYLTTFAYTPAQLVTLLLPNYFGDGLKAGYYGVPYLWETSGYLGLTTLPFLFAVNWQQPVNRWLAVLAGLFLMLAMGETIPGLYKIWTLLMPLQNIFRVAGRFMTPLLFIYVYWIASGCANLCQKKTHWGRGHVLASITLLIVAGFFAIPSVRSSLSMSPVISSISATPFILTLALGALVIWGIRQITNASAELKIKRYSWLFFFCILVDLSTAHARYFGTTNLKRFAPMDFNFGDWRIFSDDANYKLLTQAPMHHYFNLAGREARNRKLFTTRAPTHSNAC